MLTTYISYLFKYIAIRNNEQLSICFLFIYFCFYSNFLRFKL